MDKIIQQISKHPIFQGCDVQYLEDILLPRMTLKEFSGGEEIDISEKSAVCIIVRGSATAYSTDSSKSLILRYFGVGEMFGIASLFTDKTEISRIRSRGPSKIAFLDKDAVHRIILEDKCANLNFIKFLSGRVSFLNEKITYLTAGAPERRLALYLASRSELSSFSENFSMSALSDVLDIGRASLYRAITKLQNDNFIVHHGKRITVLDRNAMLSVYG